MSIQPAYLPHNPSYMGLLALGWPRQGNKVVGVLESTQPPQGEFLIQTMLTHLSDDLIPTTGQHHWRPVLPNITGQAQPGTLVSLVYHMADRDPQLIAFAQCLKRGPCHTLQALKI